MPEKRTKIPFPMPDSPPVDAVEVRVIESTERWTDVTLEDGTTLRVRPSILGALRVEGQHDPEGNPMYQVKAQLQILVSNAPAALQKAAADAKAN